MEWFDKVKFSIDEGDVLEDKCLYNVSIKIPLELGFIDDVKIIFESLRGREEFRIEYDSSDSNYAYFNTSIELYTLGIYYYHFTFLVNDQEYIFKNFRLGDYNTIYRDDRWKLSCNFSVADWAQGEVMYHVFLDRFRRNKDVSIEEFNNRRIHESWDDDVVVGPNSDGKWNVDYYGGNIRGLIDKLEYIKSLGVSIIYLSPICFSQSNHRYDTSDYEVIDPYLGNNSDLKELCDKAHSMDIKIIVDAVFNHTGNDSKYFNEYNYFDNIGASQSSESLYFDFYKKIYVGSNTLFDYWWGMKNLVVCDGNSKKWQDYIYGEGGIIDLWFSLGIDGLRLDVADELTDSFIEGIRCAVKRNKEDGFILGEVWKNPMRMGRGYISSGKGMDTVMNYTLMDALIRYFKYSDVDKLRDVFTQLLNEYPTDTLNSLMNFTSTHDISRLINIFGSDEFNYFGEWAWDLKNNDLDWQKNFNLNSREYEDTKEIIKTYVSTLAFLPGNLSIFYGDEVGIQGMGNLANRKPFPWTSADLDLLEFFQKICKIRNEEKYLKKANLDILDINDKTFIFRREKELNELLVYVNRTCDRLNIDTYFDNYDTIYSLGNTDSNYLDSHGVLVLKKK